MKLNILSVKNEKKGEKDMPSQFNEKPRSDLIYRAVMSLQANKRQPYGASPEAGKRASSYLSKRRRKYRGTYGPGQSRTPRKVMSRRGMRLYYVGATVPQTVGGRRAHPPKASKKWNKKINKKERRKAIRCALAATLDSKKVKKRGHKVPNKYPFVIENGFEKISKTKKVEEILKSLGFEKELERSSKKKVRAGKGKNRGRKYKKKKGILLVVSEKCNLSRAARNIPGIDVMEVNGLNAELLAPGAVPGRLTIFTQSALDKLEKEKLFM